jgi:hypothetical protein
VAAAVLLMSGVASADGTPAVTDRAVVDRVAVRFFSIEAGGAARPRFLTERTIAFDARIEAMIEGATTSGPYQERHIRAAVEREIADEVLSSLLAQAGEPPQGVAPLAEDIRTALLARIGGATALEAAAVAEGIDAEEIARMLRRQARAAFYLDHEVSPILHPSEEQLREVFRTSQHPFKGKKFEDVREELGRWFVAERLRVAEAAFLQSARNRVTIVYVAR